LQLFVTPDQGFPRRSCQQGLFHLDWGRPPWSQSDL